MTFALSQVNPQDSEHYGRMVELWFLFSLIWSLCASVDEDGRKKIDNFLRELEGTFPNKVWWTRHTHTHTHTHTDRKLNHSS